MWWKRDLDFGGLSYALSLLGKLVDAYASSELKKFKSDRRVLYVSVFGVSDL